MRLKAKTRRRITLTVLSIITVVGMAWGMSIENLYTLDATITDVTGIIVTAEDSRGHEWEFYGEDYKVGQEVKITFDRMETQTVTDDEIVKVK